MYNSRFDKFYIIFDRYENTYGRYCVQKSNNDHFQPKFSIPF